MIRCIYQEQPRFPATDQHPGAVRYKIGGYWVDAIGAEPSLADVQALLTPPRLVPKSVIISRLTDPQLDAALAAMTNRQKERWRSPDHHTCVENDPEMLALLRAIGADPAVVLAP